MRDPVRRWFNPSMSYFTVASWGWAAEVGQRAEVSMGSTYGRVKSKDDQLRLVQTGELERIDRASVPAFAGLADRVGSLD